MFDGFVKGVNQAVDWAMLLLLIRRPDRVCVPLMACQRKLQNLRAVSRRRTTLRARRITLRAEVAVHPVTVAATQRFRVI